MMYRLLIVDDEPYIVDGLFALFQELDQLELDVDKSYSGVEALELLHGTKYDIILTDISMPKLTGLELQKKIKEQWPKSRVIFLTGFDDFDYVQTAIRRGGSDYVLKTEGDEAIVKAVKKAVEEIEEEMKNQQLLDKARRNMLKARPLLQEKYMLDLANGINNDTEKIKQQFRELNISLDSKGDVLIVMGCIDYHPRGVELTSLMYNIQSIAEDYLSDKSDLFSIIYKERNIAFFLQPAKKISSTDEGNNTLSPKWTRFIVFVEGTFDTIQKACKKNLETSTSFVIGKEPISWQKISEKIEAIKVTLSKGIGLNREMVLSDRAFNTKKNKNQAENKLRHQLKKVSLLETYLENGQEKDFFVLLTQLMDTVLNNKSIKVNILTETYYTISTMLLSYMNRIDIISKVEQEIEVNKLIRIESHTSWEEVAKFFEKIAHFIFEKKRDEYLTNTNNVIDYVENYVEKNLDKDISLTKLAEIVHLNPSYLSRLYKEYRNKSLSSYIAELKIIKAKKLLSDCYIKINEVAEAIGIDNPSYFARYFKKYTEMTPSEYRESLNK